MSALRQVEYISADEYLARESGRESRHEYVNGVEYAMGGATRRHNLICGNVASLARQSPRFRKPIAGCSALATPAWWWSGT